MTTTDDRQTTQAAPDPVLEPVPPATVPAPLDKVRGERAPRPAIDLDAPVLPEWARSREAFARNARRIGRVARYRMACWARDLIPVLFLLAVVYPWRGIGRIVAKLSRYLYDYDSAKLQHEHAGREETPEYVKAQNVRRSHLKARWMVATLALVLVAGPILAWTAPKVLAWSVAAVLFVWIVKLIPGKHWGEIVGAAAVAGAVGWWLPTWLVTIPHPPAWAVITVAVLVWLGMGWVGRPVGKSLTKARALPLGVIEKISAPVVVEALTQLGHSKMTAKTELDAATQIRLLSDPVRCGDGYQMDLELPKGVAADYVIKRRAEFAGGIRRELGCVFLSVGPRHPGHLVVFVSDQPMVDQDQAEWPLLKTGKVDLFRGQPMVTDQRGAWVPMTFAYASMVIGAVPRMGKTFLLRQALIVAGLDPRAKVYALDGKATGDLSACQLFAHFYSRGTRPEEIERVRAMLRELRRELVIRADFIDGLPREECPENKVTSELATRYRQLCPIVVGIDETQMYFDYGDASNREHKAIREELAAGITELVKLGPAQGIIVLLATQNVNKTTIPRQISTNAVLRACLKVSDQVENDQILGTGAYSRGVDATQLSEEDKGILYLKADGQRPRLVRSVVGLDGVVAESVAARARDYREQGGTLSGDAAGEDATEQALEVDLLDDVREVMDAEGGRNMSLEQLRECLTLLRPTLWGHLDNDALGGMLRGANVEPRSVHCPHEGRTMKGLKREWVNVSATDDPDEDEGAEVLQMPRR